MDHDDRAGNDPLYRILYFSRAHADTVVNLDEAFPSILQTAQRKNPCMDITGGLLACDGWFVQVLEGQRGSVEATFDQTCNDERHEDVHVMRAGVAAERPFPHWNMCGRALSPLDDEIVGVLEKGGIFDPRQISVDQGVTLLQRTQLLQDKHADAFLHAELFRDSPEHRPD